jgi:DNA polymerase III subunit epsilon
VSHGYAVLDLETTGLFPGGRDRVIEIAVLGLGEGGVERDSYSTLVNPERDLGLTRIHGLTGSDVLGAPTFREVAGEVLRRLRNRIVVGHNIAFDLRFLQSEFSRMACLIPPLPSICTMHLVRRLDLGVPDHRLPSCCAALGIAHEGAHSALGDALAAAAVFREVRRRRPSAIPAVFLGWTGFAEENWPEIEVHSGPLARGDARHKADREKSLIGDLVTRLPLVGESFEEASYQDLLERVLEDRRVTREEASALEGLAHACGLGQDSVKRIHAAYLEGAVDLAYADGVVTERERRELDEFAVLLGLETRVVEALIRDRSGQTSVPVSPDAVTSGSKRDDLTGRTVCFTGEFQCTLGGNPISRDMAQALATNAGLMVARSVTKRLDLLVVADPDSLSSKTRKAREYGTRIVVESVFWRSIGALVD